jgi:SAM-dependent methyltransferase
MKLSTLVNYYNQLDSLSIVPTHDLFTQQSKKIFHEINSQPLQPDELLAQLTACEKTVADSFQQYEQLLSHTKQQVKNLITESEKSWFVESYRLYDEEMSSETVEEIQARTIKNISEDTKNFYLARIAKYNSWKHAAIILRPGFEPYLNHMVGCDPLYVVDTRHELLEPALSQHNEVYQQRLRPYVVSEREDQQILCQLPNNQIGFVLAYNFFNFRPFEIIRRYLQEIYTKLQPGGVLAMTINDCERDKAVMLVEQHFCCYTPGYLVCDLAESLGYEIILTWNDLGPSTWLELKKPGNFESVRGGQTLAKTIPKPVAESK